jgi:multidrug transporter EmrE-like cation transporter
MLHVLMVFAVLALTVYGQLVMKARALAHAGPAGQSGKLHYLASMLSDVAVLTCLGAAALAAILWMLAIERLEVSFAYPFMALSFVLVPLGSMVVFGERVPPMQFVGLGLIVVGVVVSTLAR